MEKLKKRLLNLAFGEFAAIIAFIFAYSQFDLGRASLFAFVYLIFLLVQGSMYWLYRYLLIVHKKKVTVKAITLLRFFRILNLVLLIIIGALIPFINNGLADFILSLGIFLFGGIEYVNYYWFRLSYGKSGFNVSHLLETGLTKSSIHKLLSK